MRDLKMWQIILLILAGLFVFGWIGNLIADEVPHRYHDTLAMIGNWTGVAGIVGFLVRTTGRLPANEHPAWKYALGTLIAFGFVLYFWFKVDDGCYVDWDGRSNPTVCE